ncbi:hypothetical protein BGW80DRAFT_1566860 [Lactifluus volemus]|nr:hypothetical protein BGW80DRAFT_1566860 [Lactifluus volemus]
MEKSEKLLNELGGGHKVAIAQSVADVASKCDIIIFLLARDKVVKSIFKDIVAAPQAQPPAEYKIFVGTSTVYHRIASMRYK